MAQPEWIRKIIRWIRRIFSTPRRATLKILENYHSEDGKVSVFRLQDTSIPGCVEIWRIDRHYERVQFFIALINLSILKSDLGVLRISQRDLLKTRTGSSVADDIQGQLLAQATISASHYWISGFREEFSGIDPKGRHFRSSRITNLKLLACDLQGASGSFAGERYSRRYARRIITQIANNEFREYSQHRTWQASVKAIDWAVWLEGLCRSSSGGIAPDHTLQPPRSNRLRDLDRWS